MSQFPHVPPPATSTTSGKAIAAMILGIIGLTGGAAPLGIIALVLGYSARNDIRASGGTLDGDGMATAGIVLGWIAVVLMVLGCACGGLFFLLFLAGAAAPAV
ncbi:MAG: DUF4190 domain-containing protein [Phycisphaeraceae bacterium]